MAEFLWYWSKGNKKIYTRKIDIAEKALHEGLLVKGLKVKPTIFNL